MKTFLSLNQAVKEAAKGSFIVLVGETAYLPESGKDWQQLAFMKWQKRTNEILYPHIYGPHAESKSAMALRLAEFISSKKGQELIKASKAAGKKYRGRQIHIYGQNGAGKVAKSLKVAKEKRP